MTTGLKIYCDDETQKYENVDYILESQRRQKWGIDWAVEGIRSDDELLLDYVAGGPEMVFMIPHVLNIRGEHLDRLFNALNGTGGYVYESYVLSGEVGAFNGG